MHCTKPAGPHVRYCWAEATKLLTGGAVRFACLVHFILGRNQTRQALVLMYIWYELKALSW